MLFGIITLNGERERANGCAKQTVKYETEVENTARTRRNNKASWC
jgi:hypothetical protein